ncbi:hypothetical protein B2D07_00830 [Desulfococcus multivorans]|uniref:Uncharacterized protein n=1 Tax=Desulfococcus multivorans DSM 2059 TaxID=1121405 RepID=S7TVN1_DESML|nr:hypothetical protein B2D07_00830 [Desulfococcus multivorans]EPR40805.1 hypothetical protein dsmv_2308 [Desulfococcus multivorans DSM 2059]SKA20962.1 hypothetical protein SAMN02745446_03268 [Desulfococcus multivorans DSM 2059]
MNKKAPELGFEMEREAKPQLSGSGSAAGYGPHEVDVGVFRQRFIQAPFPAIDKGQDYQNRRDPDVSRQLPDGLRRNDFHRHPAGKAVDNPPDGFCNMSRELHTWV